MSFIVQCLLLFSFCGFSSFFFSRVSVLASLCFFFLHSSLYRREQWYIVNCPQLEIVCFWNVVLLSQYWEITPKNPLKYSLSMHTPDQRCHSWLRKWLSSYYFWLRTSARHSSGFQRVLANSTPKPQTPDSGTDPECLQASRLLSKTEEKHIFYKAGSLKYTATAQLLHTKPLQMLCNVQMGIIASIWSELIIFVTMYHVWCITFMK